MEILFGASINYLSWIIYSLWHFIQEGCQLVVNLIVHHLAPLAVLRAAQFGQ